MPRGCLHNERHSQATPRDIVSQFLARIVGLVLLRNGPQELPASRQMLMTAAGVYILIGTLALLPGSEDALAALAANVLDVAVLFLYTRALLGLAGHTGRFLQVALAVLLVNIVFSLVAWPLMLSLPAMGSSQASGWQLIWMVVLLWNIAAVAHIYRHAMGFRLAGGVAVALGYLILSTLVVTLFLAAGDF